MKELTKHIFDEQEGKDFADIIWKILNREITETDEVELKQYIEFYNDNKPCELVMRPIEGGIEIGMKQETSSVFDAFEDWGNAN